MLKSTHEHIPGVGFCVTGGVLGCSTGLFDGGGGALAIGLAAGGLVDIAGFGGAVGFGGALVRTGFGGAVGFIGATGFGVAIGFIGATGFGGALGFEEITDFGGAGAGLEGTNGLDGAPGLGGGAPG